MIIYSIVPMEIVMGNYNDNASKNSYLEVEYMGERLQVSPVENNQYIINRLISTSPKAYLNPGLQPGTVIDGFKLTKKPY